MVTFVCIISMRISLPSSTRSKRTNDYTLAISGLLYVTFKHDICLVIYGYLPAFSLLVTPVAAVRAIPALVSLNLYLC